MADYYTCPSDTTKATIENGTMQNPWKLATNFWGSVSPGDELRLLPNFGATKFSEELTMLGGGDSDNQLTVITAPGESEIAIFDGLGTLDRPINTYTFDYITFDSIEVKNGTQYGVYLNSGGTNGFNFIRNCVIHDIVGSAGEGYGDGIRIGTPDNFIYNNVIYNCGDDGISLPAAVNATDNEISYNTIYDINISVSNAGDCIEVKETCHRTHIHHNVLTKAPTDDEKQAVILAAEDCIVENNTISGGKVGLRVSDTGQTIRNNIFTDIDGVTGVGLDGSTAIIMDSGTTATVVGNVFKNCRIVATTAGATSLLNFYGNTILGNETVSGTYGVYAGTDATLVSKNNIFTGVYSEQLVYSVSSATYTGSNNSYYPESTDFLGWNSTKYSTVSAFATAASETDSIAEDPLVTSEGKLYLVSPAIGEGTNISGVTTGDDRWGNQYTVPYNIGAYQGNGYSLNPLRYGTSKWGSGAWGN